MSDQSTVPPLPLDCSPTIALLFPYLDRELGPIETEAVAAHLAACGHCANLFRFENNVLAFLGERLARTRAPEPLRGRIAALCRPGGSGG
jgi:anti-sigma factor (TIGR02949 family)